MTMTQELQCQEFLVRLRTKNVNWTVIASLGMLGKKWSLLIISDIGLLGMHRFNEMLRATPGLTPRVLSKRLRELQRDGFVTLIVKRPNWVRWDLTQKGYDALPLFMALMQFGSKWFADEVCTRISSAPSSSSV